MSNKTVTGFGNSKVNGTYIETGTYNEQPYYVKNANTIMAYYAGFMPYSNGAGYYIMRITQIASGAIPIMIPEYKINGTDPTATTWVAMLPATSGTTAIGSVS